MSSFTKEKEKEGKDRRSFDSQGGGGGGGGGLWGGGGCGGCGGGGCRAFSYLKKKKERSVGVSDWGGEIEVNSHVRRQTRQEKKGPFKSILSEREKGEGIDI